MILRKIFFIFIFCLTFSSMSAQGFSLSAKDEVLEDSGLMMNILGADDAQSLGLGSLAERLYQEVLKSDRLSETERRNAQLKLTIVLISNGKYEEAEKILELLKGDSGARYQLRKAMVLFDKNEYEASRKALENLDAETVPKDEKAWYYLTLGLLDYVEGDFSKSENYFGYAKEACVTVSQTILVELNILRSKMLGGNANQEYADELKKKLESQGNDSAAFLYARGYAAVLHKLGETKEALEVLEKYLSLAQIQKSDEEDTLLFLMSLLIGVDTTRGKLALETLIRRGSNRDLQKVSLYLRASVINTPEEKSNWKNLLDELLGDPEKKAEEQERHPLKDELYLMRAQIALNEEDYTEAEVFAQALISEFPASLRLEDTRRLLAFIAWKHEPPQYRTAADYLNRIRLQKKEGIDRARLGMLVADCYFLNQDYDNASELYGQILAENIPEKYRGRILFQQILSDLRSEKIEQAREHLEDSQKIGMRFSEERWRAEWNFIDALEKLGKYKEAAERVQSVLTWENRSSIPKELIPRLMLRQAKLSMQTSQSKGVPELTDRIREYLDTLPNDVINEEDRASIGSNSLLIKARALMVKSNVDEAIEIFAELRTKYPGSDSAILSFMEEARFLLASGNTVEAQQRFIALADNYPENPNAAVALYEASACAELLGLERTLRDAVDILERLITNYAENNLVYFAQLKQGDILRKLNEFGAAQSRYEELLQKYPDREDRFQAEMALAYCFYAQPARLQDAIVSLERLFDLPNLPDELRIEAGFLWANALEKNNNILRAEEVYWKVISRFLINSTGASTFGVKGRYWIARSVFELGSLMEQSNRVADAVKAYNLIINYNLPGVVTAQARRKKFTEINNELTNGALVP